MAKPVIIPIRGDVRGLEQAMRSVDARVGKTQQGVERFGRVLAGVFAGGAALRGLSSVLTTTATFDTTIREAGSAAGATRREMDQLAASARALGVEQKLGAVGATEAAKAQRELIKAGVSVRDAVGGATRAVLTAASADGADITRTSEAVAQALNMFKMRGSEASVVADQMATVAATTSSSIEGVAESMVTGSSAAKEIGFSFKDLNVTLAALALGGTKGAEAGTAVKSALMQLAKPTEAAQKAYKKYGIELFDSNKNLKSAKEIAGELEKGLGGLTAKQRTATLQTMAGTYGFRTLSALMQQGADGAGRLTVEMGKQGTAAKMAQERNAGLGGTLAAAKAGWQELKLSVGEAIAPQATKALEGFTKSLREAGKSGELKELLEDVGDGMGTVVKVGESAARVGGAVVSAWAAVPRPMRDAAAAMLVAAFAASKLNAAIGAGGAAGAAGGVASAGGLAGRGRDIVTSTGPTGFLATRQARSAATGDWVRARDESRRLQSLQGMNNPLLLRQQMAAAEAQRAAAAQKMYAAQRAVTPMRMPAVAGRSMAVAGAAGALGTVMGGGNMLQAAGSAAMAGGMVAGPWGAVGGAIAAAAGTGLVSLLKGRAADAAAEMGKRAGEEVRNVMAQNLDSAAVASLTKLRTESEKLRAELERKLADGNNDAKDTRPVQDRLNAASRKEGRTLASGWQRRVGGLRNRDPLNLAQDFITKAEPLEHAGQQAAAKQATAYVRSLEKAGKIAKGATDKFRKELKGQLSFDVTGTAKAELKVDLKKDAGKTADELKKKLIANGKLSIKVDDLVQVEGALDIDKLVGSAKTQRKQLDDIAKGRTGASKKERDEAASARKELDRLTAAFERKTKKAKDRAAANTLKADGDAAGRSVDPLKRYAGAMREAAAARALYEAAGDGATLELTPPPTPGSPGDRPRRRNENRRGGLIRRFRGGGMVPVAVSPGEAIQFPGGGWGMVPGDPVAADNVFGQLPVGARVFTGHGQALMAAGYSPDRALAEQMPHFAKGGTVKKSQPATDLNKQYPAHPLSESPWRPYVPAATVKRLAASVGLPGTAFQQIARGESGYRPGVISSDQGHGLWQMTPRVWDAKAKAHMAQLGGLAAMRVPVKNALMARYLFADAQRAGGNGLSPWFGTKYLTDKGAGSAKLGKVGDIGSGSGPGGRNIMLGASKSGRTGLVEGAFQAGFQRGLSGYSYEDRQRYGSPILRGVSEGLASGTYTREAPKSSRSSRSSAGVPGKGWLRPTASGPMSSNYGPRRAPKKGASSNHDGVDISVPTGTPVRAVKAGSVTMAGPNGGYGNYVRLAHSGGYASFYGHLSSIDVRKGARVKRGQRIALSGNTGTSTGPHLHFGMAKGGASVNPASVVKFRRGGAVGRQRFAGGGLVGGGFSDSLVRLLGGKPGGGGAVVPPPNDLKRLLAGGLGSGGAAFYKALAAQADETTWGIVDRRRKELQKVVNAGGDAKVVARARASLSILEDALGAKVGRLVGAASQTLDARGQGQTALSTWQRKLDIDPGSAKGIAGSIEMERRFLRDAPTTRAGLETAIKRAERSKDKEAADAARQALRDFNNQTEDAAASIADLQRASVALAVAQQEAAHGRAAGYAGLTEGKGDDAWAAWNRAGWERGQAWAAALRGDVEGRADWELKAAQSQAEGDQASLEYSRDVRGKNDRALELEAAWASLTETLDDDRAVSAKRLADKERQMAEAQAAGDEEHLLTLIGEVRSLRDEAKAQAAEAQQSTEAQNDLLKQQLADRDAVIRAISAQNINQVLAGVVSGVVGGDIRSRGGFPTQGPRY